MTHPERSRRFLVVSLTCLFAVTGRARSENTDPQPTTRRVDAALAHRPRYADKALWPADVEKTAYFKEAWAEAPLLVWAHPGESGGVPRAGRPPRGLDATNPKNWLEDGKPATRTPDETTDVLLPDAPEGSRAYAVTWGGGGNARHVTVGKGAYLWTYASIYGNLWIKKGGAARAVHFFKGQNDTFVRNDNETPMLISDHVKIIRSADASVEFIGRFETTDDLNLISGTMVVAPGSEFAPGDRSVQGIYPEASLVLHSGSRFHKRGNQEYSNDIVVAGRLLAGTPERPLTEDCFLGISYKDKGRSVKADDPRYGMYRPKPTDYGLVIMPEGLLRVHSANPEKARLVFGWHGCASQSNQSRAYEKEFKDLVPHKIDFVFLGDVGLNGVVFDDVRKGGIMMLDPAARKAWRNVFYGDGNEGQPHELYDRFEGEADQFNIKG